MIGREIGHKFVALIIALSLVEPERERDCVGEVARVGGRELVIHSRGGYKRTRTFQERIGPCRERPLPNLAQLAFTCCRRSCSAPGIFKQRFRLRRRTLGLH